MKSQTATRALLALVLLCLAILIVRGLRDDEPPPQAAGPEPAASASAKAAKAARKPVKTPPAAPSPQLTREDIHIFIEGLGKPELPAEVRVWTAEQLARATIEEEAVDAALRAILEDPDPQVAAAAAAALSQRGEPAGATSPETPDRGSPSDAGEPAPPGMRIETLD